MAVHRSEAEALYVENPPMLTYLFGRGHPAKRWPSPWPLETWAARLHVKGGHGALGRDRFRNCILGVGNFLRHKWGIFIDINNLRLIRP